jgi:tetratricopeptide (TPR) repeat protein
VKAKARRPGGEGVLAVAQRADTDRWRRQLREASWRRDAKALKALAADQQVSAQPPATVVLLGSALRGVDAAPLAIAVLRSAQQRHPNDFWLNHDLAFALAMSRPAEPGQAVGYYRAALALRPESPGVCLNLGSALQDNGELAEAVAAFQRAIALKPDYADAHNNLGSALYAKGRLDEAIVEFREAIRLDPGDPKAHSNLGNALRDKGRVDEAIAECRVAIRIKPDYFEAHNNLGNALSDKGQVDDAIAEYRVAIRINPESAEAHNNLGFDLMQKGRLDEAIAECRKATRLKKGFALAYRNLGRALYAKGLLDEAIVEFWEAIRHQKDYFEAHHDLGNALSDKGRLDEAIAEYQEAIRLKKDDALVHYSLGNALRDRGDVTGAVAEFRRAIALKPDYPEAHCNLGLVLKRQGQFRQALEALRLGDKLGRAQGPRWRYPSAQWVRQCERLIELDRRLPDFLAGTATPTGPAEQIELAELCTLKKQYAAATRFYADAFATQAKLAEDRVAGHRYKAAGTAALAGAGRGEGSRGLDAKECARLRELALGWLRAEVAACGRELDHGPAEARPLALRCLQYGLVGPDFAGVRNPEALAQLPERERQAWQQLWADVRDRLARGRGPATPKKGPATK